MKKYKNKLTILILSNDDAIIKLLYKYLPTNIEYPLFTWLFNYNIYICAIYSIVKPTL